MKLRVQERILTEEADGIAGYLAHPTRDEPGPALLLVHQNTGVTGYIKIEAYKYAKLGYTTFIPSLFDLCGFPEITHLPSGRQIQHKISDDQFRAATRRGWDFLKARQDVDTARMAVGGYCMGGRLAINFVAATPDVRAFVAYYPTVRDEPTTPMRPRPAWDLAREIKCPSIVLYGADDVTTGVKIQEWMWKAFLENGQPLEWHYFAFGGHGYCDPDAAGYFPHAAELTWPLVVDFLARELDNYPAC
jgi:carboxymethylenebutenolidase